MIQENIVKSSGLSFKDLIVQIKNIKEQSISGNLVVKVEAKPSWLFSFRMGRLGWVGGGLEPINRWQRSLSQVQLNLSPDKLEQVNNPQVSLDSHLLAQLLADEWIDRQQCAELTGKMTVECLFDIIQFSQHSGNRLSCQFTQTGASNTHLNLSLPLLEIEPILTKSIQIWQEWSNAGLAVYSPGLFPIVSKSTELEKIVAAYNLQQAIVTIDGNRTLRSLAINNRQSILSFTSSILPLLRSGFITLSPHPKSTVHRGERSESSNQLSTNRLNTQPITASTGNISTKYSPLIACIDDSILIYQSLEKIITSHGYRTYGVQDPLKIMPSLIRNKPDFIFLDLLMPIVNGYEVCEQIRKTPSLKDIPVIILTGKDGLIDRMRSKMVGATGFLGKPIDEESVLKMIAKYLLVSR
jgi:two-component system, chemotaxis family, response regulator PixG